METRKKVYADKMPDPLRGLIICADCGARLYLQRQSNRDYAHLDCYYCGTYKRAKDVCTNHRVLVSSINDILLKELRYVTDMVNNHLDEFTKALQKSFEKTGSLYKFTPNVKTKNSA
ncbi:MAG: zinc ribbon domain-containing protein [Ruminococcus sp.]|nr:zinc ribbon domain-containing protein [Ruminococcus sp.]